MTKLREIAFRYANNPVGKQVQTDIATLLNAVVNEKAAFIERTDEDIQITARAARKKALRELDLDKVWPLKEEG